MLTMNISEDVEQMEFLYNPVEIVKLYSLFDKKYIRQFLIQYNIHLFFNTAISFLIPIQEKFKNVCQNMFIIIFIATLFTVF